MRSRERFDREKLKTSVANHREAWYAAREYYTVIREFPSGKGLADICFLPRKIYGDKPAAVIELKWDKSAVGAIGQIKEKQYEGALKEYYGNLLLVGINYDKETKKHTCVIERFLSATEET